MLFSRDVLRVVFLEPAVQVGDGGRRILRAGHVLLGLVLGVFREEVAPLGQLGRLGEDVYKRQAGTRAA